jgi:hypothetical protein
MSKKSFKEFCKDDHEKTMGEDEESTDLDNQDEEDETTIYPEDKKGKKSKRFKDFMASHENMKGPRSGFAIFIDTQKR